MSELTTEQMIAWLTIEGWMGYAGVISDGLHLGRVNSRNIWYSPGKGGVDDMPYSTLYRPDKNLSDISPKLIKVYYDYLSREVPEVPPAA